MKKLAILFEFNPASETHAATNAAIEHSKKLLEIDLDVSWISTKDISENLLNHFHGFSVAPGSPYNNSMCAADSIWCTVSQIAKSLVFREKETYYRGWR